ncbi:MAG TPA: hypothetical protein VD706_01200 [Candidatus Saccharimonadales bacterium]|nr:hypothetical protein [Candidatus Saccharimonadales bacterium]
MRTLVKPRPVELETPRPSFYVEGEPHGIPMHTAFFRLGIHLPEAFDVSMASVDRNEEFSFISAGCGPGSELDSGLVLHRANDEEGAVWARGFDASSIAIAAAQRGHYRVNRLLHTQVDRVLADLEGFGFDTEIREPDSDDPIQKPVGVIRSAPVREGYDIGFEQRDLTEPLSLSRRPHLVLVNNLLYHMEPPKALRVVRNLSWTLARGGVMSFDDHTAYVDSHRRGTLARLMTEEFGMEPVHYNRNGHPTIFKGEE